MLTVQLPLGIRLHDQSVFDSFLPARNDITVATLKQLAEGELSRLPTCLWLHGAPGTGKTHLLQAACARAGAVGRRCAYLPLSEVAVLGPELLTGYGELAFVCLDDAQLIAGQRPWERAVFSLHQELDERGGKLLVSGEAPPAALGFQLRDLGSRLNGGLVLSLQALDEAEQVAALQLHAQVRGLQLSEDVAYFIVRRMPRDMASLCAFLGELDEASLAAQRRLTIPLVKAVMEQAR